MAPSAVTEDEILDALLTEQGESGCLVAESGRISACRSGIRSGLSVDVLLRHYGQVIFQKAIDGYSAEPHNAAKEKREVIIPISVASAVKDRRARSFKYGASAAGLVFLGVVAIASYRQSDVITNIALRSIETSILRNVLLRSAPREDLERQKLIIEELRVRVVEMEKLNKQIEALSVEVRSLKVMTSKEKKQ